MARDGWSPTTMTLSDEVIAELKRRIDSDHKQIGKVADEVLRQALFYSPDEQLEVDHTEVLEKVQECIRVHWNGDHTEFIKALRTIVGKRIPFNAVTQWTRDKKVTEPELAGLEEIFRITDALPKPPSA